MSIFTFVSECTGSTIVEQKNAASLNKALIAWARDSAVAPDVSLHVVPVRPARLTGLVNAWCFSGFTKRGTFFITNVIKTAAPRRRTR
jgi:hypothetical protein